MGMDQRVRFAGSVPGWPAVRSLLTERGFPVQVGMIDGELAFPDEEPPEAWRELRLHTPLGMVTVRREGGEVVLIVWGNADGANRQAWHALTWAFAEAGGGEVGTGAGPQSAGDFRRAAELPDVLRGD